MFSPVKVRLAFLTATVGVMEKIDKFKMLTFFWIEELFAKMSVTIMGTLAGRPLGTETLISVLLT
jgi:hypothetical protein